MHTGASRMRSKVDASEALAAREIDPAGLLDESSTAATNHLSGSCALLDDRLFASAECKKTPPWPTQAGTGSTPATATGGTGSGSLPVATPL